MPVSLWFFPQEPCSVTIYSFPLFCSEVKGSFLCCIPEVLKGVIQHLLQMTEIRHDPSELKIKE